MYAQYYQLEEHDPIGLHYHNYWKFSVAGKIRTMVWGLKSVLLAARLGLAFFDLRDEPEDSRFAISNLTRKRQGDAIQPLAIWVV